MLSLDLIAYIRTLFSKLVQDFITERHLDKLKVIWVFFPFFSWCMQLSWRTHPWRYLLGFHNGISICGSPVRISSHISLIIIYYIISNFSNKTLWVMNGFIMTSSWGNIKWKHSSLNFIFISPVLGNRLTEFQFYDLLICINSYEFLKVFDLLQETFIDTLFILRLLNDGKDKWNKSDNFFPKKKLLNTKLLSWVNFSLS